MRFLDDKLLRNYLLIVMTLYCAAGFFGALWVSDPWDDTRSIFFALIVIPATTLFYSMWFVYQPLWRRMPRLFAILLILLIAGQGWGVSLLLNTVSDSPPLAVRTGDGYMTMAYKRGTLGWLYRTRW